MQAGQGGVALAMRRQVQVSGETKGSSSSARTRPERRVRGSGGPQESGRRMGRSSGSDSGWRSSWSRRSTHPGTLQHGAQGEGETRSD